MHKTRKSIDEQQAAEYLYNPKNTPSGTGMSIGKSNSIKKINRLRLSFEKTFPFLSIKRKYFIIDIGQSYKRILEERRGIVIEGSAGAGMAYSFLNKNPQELNPDDVKQTFLRVAFNFFEENGINFNQKALDSFAAYLEKNLIPIPTKLNWVEWMKENNLNLIHYK